MPRERVLEVEEAERLLTAYDLVFEDMRDALKVREETMTLDERRFFVQAINLVGGCSEFYRRLLQRATAGEPGR